MPSLFIAIEGGDGSGKGTMVAALSEHFHALGHDVLTTREPGGTPQGQILRELLLTTRGAAWDPWAELLLMAAARVQHVNHVIRPALHAGRIVISDRFVGSTIAYQGAGRFLSQDAIRALHRDSTGDLQPDLTILLDLDPAIGLRRSIARLANEESDEGRFEALDLAFHKRVRASFLAQAVGHPERHVVIDASGSRDVVIAAVVCAIDKKEVQQSFFKKDQKTFDLKA